MTEPESALTPQPPKNEPAEDTTPGGSGADLEDKRLQNVEVPPSMRTVMNIMDRRRVIE